MPSCEGDAAAANPAASKNFRVGKSGTFRPPEVGHYNRHLQLLDLELPLRRRIVTRVGSMLRHYDYLADRTVAGNRQRHRPREEIEVICELNSFYQYVLGPLAASGRASRGRFLGEAVPVQYGTVLFGPDRAERVRSAHSEFMRLTARLGIPVGALTAAKADDLLLALGDSGEIEPGDDVTPF
jgi:hypothetical protein